MGVDLGNRGLKNKNNYIHFNWAGWRYVTNLAIDHGWKPMGTTLDKDFMMVRGLSEEEAKRDVKEWDGGYGSNDGQLVSKEDALNMRDALIKALPSEIREAKEDKKVNKYWIPKLKKFISFLNNGEFDIL